MLMGLIPKARTISAWLQLPSSTNWLVNIRNEA
jgi:hypothetical protein